MERYRIFLSHVYYDLDTDKEWYVYEGFLGTSELTAYLAIL